MEDEAGAEADGGATAGATPGTSAESLGKLPPPAAGAPSPGPGGRRSSVGPINPLTLRSWLLGGDAGGGPPPKDLRFTNGAVLEDGERHDLARYLEQAARDATSRHTAVLQAGVESDVFEQHVRLQLQVGRQWVVVLEGPVPAACKWHATRRHIHAPV